jgi:hypothetical protein
LRIAGRDADLESDTNMGLKLSIIGLAGIGLLASACATQNHQMARIDAATTLRNAPAMEPTAVAKVGAESAAWGDRWTAANLFEKSTDRSNSVRQRFDLAATYAQTGRIEEAKAIYASLIRDGQYAWSIEDVDYRNRSAPIYRVNIAEESARRLAALNAQAPLTFAANTGAGAAAAGEFGTPTAAVVGGAPVVEHRISDADALARDAATNP